MTARAAVITASGGSAIAASWAQVAQRRGCPPRSPPRTPPPPVPPTGSFVPPSQYLRHAVHRRRLPFGASAPLCSACRLHTTRPQLPHGARQAVQAVCPSSAHTPSCAVQCCKRHEAQTRTCSSHAGCSSTRQCAMPCSAQKSSPQTEHRDEHASQPQWSCRQITRLVGGDRKSVV